MWCEALDGKQKISTHAPREGGDAVHVYMVLEYDISTHAPREGGDAV